MSGEAPRRRVAMPPPSTPPRVGKIRLGEKVDTGRTSEKTGESITRPSAVDYFRVDAEDDVTAPAAAASFARQYPDKPRSLRCWFPARRPEEAWEGAYRLYGARKLKIRCDGSECDERTATGGWDTKPCVCKARGIFDTPKGQNPHKDRCKLGWTLSFYLPDVDGVGIWQITTGSEISVRRISDWLRMMEALASDPKDGLLLMEFTLRLVPEDVTPDGATKTVWVLQPETTVASPAAMLEGTGRVAVAALEAGAPTTELPAPADDEAIEGTFDDPDDASDLEEKGRAAVEKLCQDHGLSFGEFAEAADVVGRAMGRVIDFTTINDQDVFKKVDAECRRKGEVKAAAGKGGQRKNPDDPPAPAPAADPAGTEAML